MELKKKIVIQNIQTKDYLAFDKDLYLVYGVHIKDADNFHDVEEAQNFLIKHENNLESSIKFITFVEIFEIN